MKFLTAFFLYAKHPDSEMALPFFQGGKKLMIIVLKPGHEDEDLNRLVRRLEDLGLRAHISKGEHRTIVGAIGDERIL